jgi:tetratricopeptide (TPR) repeat protein
MQYDDAIETFEQILKEDRNYESALQGQIASLRKKGHYAEATKVANDALNHSTQRPGIYSERAWISFEQGHYEEAEADFRKVVALTPKDPFSYINLAWSLVRQETGTNLDEATKHCREALNLNPTLAEAFGCLGNIAFRQGHIREAEAYFCRSIQVNPQKGHYADLGALYIQMGQYDEAKGKLDEALKNDANDAYAHLEMGNLHLQTEATKEAIREFRLAAVIDPQNPDSSNALAIALMEGNNLVEAEKVLRSAIRLLDESKRWELHLTLCRLLTRIGDETSDLEYYEEALKEANTATRLQPQHPAPYFHGGIVRFKLEDYRSALNSFRQCLRKDQHYLEAELNARRVRSLIRTEKARSRASLFASVFLAIIFLIQLIAVWILRFTTDKITDTMLTVLVPILLGLMVVAVLLPWLSRLKMTGLEADLSQPTPKESLPSGPKGEIGFGSASGKSI